MKKVLAVLLGLITGFITVFLGEMFIHMISPPPSGIDLTNPDAILEIVENMPSSVFVILLCVWGLSAFLGGMVTAAITAEKWKVLSITTGSILLLLAIINMFMVPHPIWVNISTVLMYIPLAYFGGRLVARNKKG